jgi:hypothetical protein
MDHILYVIVNKIAIVVHPAHLTLQKENVKTQLVHVQEIDAANSQESILQEIHHVLAHLKHSSVLIVNLFLLEFVEIQLKNVLAKNVVSLNTI